MDCTFLIIIFLVWVIILFVVFRICFQTTIWSAFVGALWWGLLLTLVIQAVVPTSWFDNRFSVQGVIIIIAIVLIINTIYITDRMSVDIDPRVVACTDRTVVFW